MKHVKIFENFLNEEIPSIQKKNIEKIVDFLNTWVIDEPGETRPYIDPDNIEEIAEGLSKIKFDLK